ncbi:MAG: ExbD/TolR family protein [Solirubrobacteraceae bacterium]
MANIDSSSNEPSKKRAGFSKQKKVTPNIDMTPMVDLGFLLITFFIFTATLSQQTAMDISLPEGGNNNTTTKEVATLKIILSDKQLFIYENEDYKGIKPYPYKDIRKTINSFKDKFVDNGLGKDFNVIIKPNAKANYKQTVDMLDEMIINGVKKYSLEDLDEAESILISNK